MPDRQQLLSIYLNDHLTGSSAGRDLFRRAARSQRTSPRGDELARLAREIDEDRDAQLDLMRGLGVTPSLPRVVAGKVAETLGRLKPNGTVLQRSPLSDVVELEGLRAAVAGKKSGWEALLAVSDTDGRLPRPRLEELRVRAVDQEERLRVLHVDAVREALSRPGG
jgi:hypothetical protein